MRILFIDIETTPALVYTWALFNQNISVDQIVNPTSLLCFAAKWNDSDEVMFYSAKKQEGREFDKMVRAAHKLLSEADAVCHFNGESFDIPMLNVEFTRLGLPPPPPAHQIDLKKVVKNKFRFVSSKLAFVGPALKIGEKIKNEGWPLWIGCLKGDAECWRKMGEYNIQDVVLLEDLYLKLLPWIDNHPNMNHYVDSDEPVCPNCGDASVQRRGYHRTVTQVYVRYSCNACGRWSRARASDKTAPKVVRR